MKKRRADNVQCQSNATHDEDQSWVLETLDRDESLDGLQEDADSQCQQEDTIEESTEQLRSLPAKRKVLGGLSPFGYLESCEPMAWSGIGCAFVFLEPRDSTYHYGCQSHHETDHVIHLLPDDEYCVFLRGA